MSRTSEFARETRETQIEVAIDLDTPREPGISTPLPFFSHMLSALAFHGRIGMTVRATGDVEVDPHHLVEDTGIVLGTCLQNTLADGAVRRFGHAVIPMDEALSEATIDVCGRPTLVYRAEFPQTHAGSFPVWLFREFFSGLVMGANIALHAMCRYGENSHHMVEALFKAVGRAMGEAYTLVGGDAGERMSTKGRI